MKRTSLVMMLLGTVCTIPAAAQWQGMPIWNNPKGGTGVTINGDAGFPNTNGGKGTAFGARGELGLTNLAFTAGVSSWKPDGASSSTTTWAGVGQLRVIGGSLMPVALNIQAGAGTASAITTGTVTMAKTTNMFVGAGASVNVPTPGITIEPYVSVSNRWHTPSGGSSESNIGWVLGANVGFGMFGVHVAFDSEKFNDGTTRGVFGIGAHFALNAPAGM
ncbi:MAG TPA: hypothetical protein VGU74_06780 [Gemmatimonadales bacterium]|nr:hypothetical protein [Gemmatimonadales bacterium]